MSGLPLCLDLQTEVLRSREKPFSSRISSLTISNYALFVGMREHCYGAMPRIEEMLACYLSTEAASSLKAPTLPTKPCRTTLSLVGKAYMAAGQASECLYTMAILQAYQADLLKDLDEGEGFGYDTIKGATKGMAHVIGCSMSALVAMERHLWLNLLGIKIKVPP